MSRLQTITTLCTSHLWNSYESISENKNTTAAFLKQILYTFSTNTMPNFTTTERGKKCLVHDGFMYVFGKQLKDGTSAWRCRFRAGTKILGSTCQARLWLTPNEEAIARGPIPNHSHGSDWGSAHSKVITANMKMAAKQHPQTMPSEIYLKKMVEHNPDLEVISKLPHKESLKRTIRNAQSQGYDKQPKDIYAVPDELPVQFSSFNGGRWLIFDSGAQDKNRQLIFCSNDGLRQLVNAKFYIIDGTFSTVPNIAYQLYTIHCDFFNKFLPCVYSLMSSKDEQSYKVLFEAVKDEVKQRTGKELCPEYVASDFEAAAINAVKACFPQAKLAGCLFHFSQILWRRVQKIPHLKEAYNKIEEKDLRSGFHSLVALSFVPESDIQKVFDDLVDAIDSRLLPLCAHLEKNYVKGKTVGRKVIPPKFPPSTWNCYDRVEKNLPRTINSVEGWHLKFKQICMRKHLSFYLFIQKLMEAESDAVFDRKALEVGGKLRCRMKLYENLDSRIVTKSKGTNSTKVTTNIWYI
ncbi:uncharacterized protein LOC116168214 [Photinus pyralis]|uniref:uncharacterized protein LOC116168214 n=2 Tax=Photinus pyralis TaxID=7054 RepID=UPI001266F348|nr:uncharacterized protein LOC116168214 [Photinus pyralis]